MPTDRVQSAASGPTNGDRLAMLSAERIDPSVVEEVSGLADPIVFLDDEDDDDYSLGDRIRAMRVPSSVWRGTISIGIVLLLWHLAAAYLVERDLILVGPIDAVQAMIDTWQSGELWRHMKVSGKEFGMGFGIGSAIGVPLGLVLGTLPKMKEYLDPILNGLYATPLIALAPLFILWFGIGEKKTIVLIIILVSLPVAVNTDVGIRSTDQVLLEAARSFGANRFRRFTMVQLPWSLSFIVTGLRLGVGRGLIGVVVGELFGSRRSRIHDPRARRRCSTLPRCWVACCCSP